MLLVYPILSMLIVDKKINNQMFDTSATILTFINTKHLNKALEEMAKLKMGMIKAYKRSKIKRIINVITQKTQRRKMNQKSVILISNVESTDQNRIIMMKMMTSKMKKIMIKCIQTSQAQMYKVIILKVMNQKTMMKTKMIKLSRKRIKKMKMMRRSSLILKEGFHKLQQRLTHKRTKLHQLTKIQITMLHQKKLKFHQVLLIQKRSILLRKRSLQLLVA